MKYKFIIRIIYCVIPLTLTVLNGCRAVSQNNLVISGGSIKPPFELDVSSQTPAAADRPIPQTSTPSPSLIPTATTTASVIPTQPACFKTHGEIAPGEIKSNLLSSPLVYQIYLPPCYNPNASIRYPVLILMHGMHTNENQWIHLDVNGIADSLIVSKKLIPFLIVLPREDDTLENPNESEYPEAIINVLIPWVDDHYATCQERQCRTIGGLSRGSGWALRLGFTNWALFGSIGAHSISPFEGDLNQLPIWIDAIPSTQLPRLYTDIGSSDISLQGGRDFDSALSSKNYVHEWHIFEGYHNEDYWHSHLQDYLTWYAQPWTDALISSEPKK